MTQKNKLVIVAIIPTRGGSTGVRRKNVRDFAGKPLIWHTINAAKNAKLLNNTVVSTENDEIEDYCKSEDVEILRHPAKLSIDGAPSFPVVRWALNELRKEDVNPDIVVLLRATSPLRTSEDIDNCIDMLLRSPDADSVSSVTAAKTHPLKMKSISDNQTIIEKFGNEGYQPIRRQELESLFIRNEAIHVAKASVIDDIGLWGNYCLAYRMPEERSVNINNEFDFVVAELLFNASKNLNMT